METIRLKKTRGDGLLRPQQIAVSFGVTVTTVRRWVDEGRLTAIITPGGHRRIIADRLLASYTDNNNMKQTGK